MNFLDKAIDKFIFPKRWNYLLYWVIVGFCFFLFSEFLVRIFQENYFLELRISSAVLLTGLGITGNFIRVNFNKVVLLLSEIMVFPDKTFEKWKFEIDEVLFTTKTLVAKLVIFAIYVFSIAVMTTYGLPFQNTILNIILAISLIPLLTICAFGAYMLVYLMLTLSKITKYPTNVPFYLIKHHSVLNLSAFFTQASLLILMCYAWFTFTIWISPYHLEGIILISVAIIGFYPLVMFLWSFFQIHILLQSIKQKHIQTINKQIQAALNDLQKKPSTETAELLTKLMEIQKNVESLNDFPIAIGEASTFLVTLGIPIFNVILSFSNIFKP